jgi:NAD(P)-dependent dehydrogenase (short-subunit alcohol dehydrogenase family)
MSTITQDNIEGQRALVTGATSGIGRAVAPALARGGVEVIVHGRNEARGTETVREIAAAAGRASFISADLADAGDVKWPATEVGAVDILINNGRIALFAPTAEFDAAGFDKMFATNVRCGVLRLRRRPHRERGAAIYQPRSALLDPEPSVGAERLHADLRRVPAPGR